MEMEQYIAAFPNGMKKAVEHSKNLKLKDGDRNIANVVITGLGGSGIGGTIVSKIVAEYASTPIVVNNDYTLPEFVGRETLVIACSYSGNTEETLSAFDIALENGAEIACITSGGKLKSLAEENGLNLVLMPGGDPPRTTLGWSSPQIFAILEHYGIIDDRYRASLDQVADYLLEHQFEINSKAKLLAENLHTNTPVIYSDDAYEGIAIRMRQQINENSKCLCWHHKFPEMNHNELVGWASGNDKLAVVILRTEDDHPQTQKRMELCKGIFSKYTPNINEVYAKGEDKLIRSYYLIHFVDWVSSHLADMYGVDPVEVNVIDYLKGELAKS
jgi:glucose/mannose-6-phosphate isomerase